MADTHELQEDQVVQGEQEVSGLTEAVEPSEAPVRKPRAKRTSVRAVEGKLAAIEEQVEALGREVAPISRLAEQIAELGRQLAQLDGRLAKFEEQRQPGAGDGHVQDGAGLAELVRQHEERLQKLATILAQQAWGMK